MTDIPRKPPARDPRDEEVYIPPAPDTERGIMPPRPLHRGRTPDLETRVKEFARDIQEVRTQMEGVVVASSNVMALQRKMALQLDGFGVTINNRFDIFHRELAMVRQIVTADHAPRLDDVEDGVEETKAGVQEAKAEVEKVSRAQRAKEIAGMSGKVAAYGTLIAVVGRAVGKMWPQFGDGIESILAVFGL